MAVNYMVVWAILGALACACQGSPAGADWKRALDSPYASELKRCRDEWTQISSRNHPEEVPKCLHNLLLAVAPRMAEPGGVPSVGIEQLDPLSINQSFPVGSEVVRGVTDNWVVTGLTSGLTPDNSAMTYNPRSKEATLTVRLPEEAGIKCNYDLEMRIGTIFGQNDADGVNTSGTAEGKAGKVVFTMTFVMGYGKYYELKLKASRSYFRAETMQLKFTGNDPEDPLTKTINIMTSSNEVAMSILDETKPHLNAIMAKNFGALFHKGWKVLDEL